MEKETQEQLLTAGDIFDADDLGIETMEVPEWKKNGKPGVLGLRVLTAEEVIKFQDVLKSETGKKSGWIRILALAACDAQGNRLFTENDIEKLKKKNAAVFFRAQKQLLQMNGMARSEKTWEKLKEILESANVDGAVIALVQMKWDASDEASAKNA